MAASLAIPLDRMIRSLLSPNPSGSDVREFVYFCKNLSLSYLKTKVNRGRLDPGQFGIPLADLALDCIASLFERDDRGRFVEFVNYFGNEGTQSFSDEELLGAVRRLVFSKVNEELFRLYRENDPSLSNLIRNVKIALRYSQTLIPVVQNNEFWIQPFRSVRSNEGMPLMPAEFLEARLLAELGGNYDLRQILHTASEVLEDQNLYQKRYPLVGMALVIRSLMVRPLRIPDEVEMPGSGLSADDVHRFIRESIQKTKIAMAGSYVEKGKMSEKMFEIYFDCVREILEAEFTSDDSPDLSYFDVIRKRMTRLSADEYRGRHRVYLEYLVRLTRMSFLGSIKGELQSY